MDGYKGKSATNGCFGCGGADKKLDSERKEICIQRKKSGKRWKSTRGKEA